MKKIALLCVGLSFVLFVLCGNIKGSRGHSAGNNKIGTITSMAGQFVKKTRPVMSKADREKLEDQMRRAVRRNDLESAKKCLEAGVDVNIKNGDGDNLLYTAVDCDDSPEMFQLLLDYGIKKDVPDRDGVTPLEYLVKKIGFIYPTDVISDKDRNKLKMLEAILKERDEYETLGVKVLKKSINDLINGRMSQIAADAAKILIRAFIFIDSPSGGHLSPDRISINGLPDFLRTARSARRSNAKYPTQYSNASN